MQSFYSIIKQGEVVTFQCLTAILTGDLSGAFVPGCLNLHVTYPDGEENPSLWDMDGIPLYKYEGGEVVPRTEEELADDRGVLPKPEDKPSSEERIAELEAALAALLGGDANG